MHQTYWELRDYRISHIILVTSFSLFFCNLSMQILINSLHRRKIWFWLSKFVYVYRFLLLLFLFISFLLSSIRIQNQWDKKKKRKKIYEKQFANHQYISNGKLFMPTMDLFVCSCSYNGLDELIIMNIDMYAMAHAISYWVHVLVFCLIKYYAKNRTCIDNRHTYWTRWRFTIRTFCFEISCK